MYISYIQIESNVLYYHPLLPSQIIFDRTEHSLKYNFFLFSSLFLWIFQITNTDVKKSLWKYNH